MNSQDPNDSRKMPARKRRAPWAVAAGSIALVASLMVAPAASADMIGPYNIDGIFVPDDEDPDYEGETLLEISDAAGNSKELGPLNASTTKIGVIHNDTPPTLGDTNPNAQVDLNTAWLDTTRVSDGEDGFIDYLYFAWARDKDTGSGFIAYEFMKSPPPPECVYDGPAQALIDNCNPWKFRQAGDFLILWDQQGGSTELLVRKWSGTSPNLVLGPAAPLSNYDAAYSEDNFRGEAAINLTANNLGSGGSCNAFANVIPSTVTGNSDTADYKDTILNRIPLSNCTTKTETTPTDAGSLPSPVTSIPITTAGVVAVKDRATVSLEGGSATPAGRVNFWLCKIATGTCDGTLPDRFGTPIGFTNLSGPSYPVTVHSPTAWVTAAGRYCWRAEFTGDAANEIPGSRDFRETECFEVTPVLPTLTTSAGSDVVLGSAVTDTATLSGTAPQPTTNIIETSAPDPLTRTEAAGTITFTLYTANCTAVPNSSSQVTVSGDSSAEDVYSASFTPLAAGTYHWGAVYSGNGPNTRDVTHNAACNDPAQTVVVNTVPTSLTSAQRWVPNDWVTVNAANAAAGDLAGTVSFKLYPNATCNDDDDDGIGDNPVYSVDVPVAGPSGTVAKTSNTTEVLVSDSFSWLVSFTSTKDAYRSIAPSCHETSVLTITNGGTINSP